jgi:copper ion binding protein
MEQATVKVNGMTCQGCVRSVKKVLERVTGVQSADVSLEKAQAEVVFDPARANVEQLKAAVEDAGYEAG